MTTTDGPADEAAIEEGAGLEDEAADEDEGPPYSRLDEETAAKCGLWLE